MALPSMRSHIACVSLLLTAELYALGKAQHEPARPMVAGVFEFDQFAEGTRCWRLRSPKRFR